MAKDKKSSKVAASVPASKPATSKNLDTIKAGRVGKSADKAKTVAKETAKKAANGLEKKKKKSKKEPTPEPSESEEEDDTSESSASSDDADSDSESEPALQTNGVAKADSDSDSEADDDTSDESDSDEEEAVSKPNGKAAAVVDDEDDSDDSDESSDADSEDDDENEVNGSASKVAKAAAEESSDSDSDSDEEEEAAPKIVEQPSKKRKAEDVSTPSAKKSKVTVNGEEKEPCANLWIGNLSFNLDEEWLQREFSEYGEVKGARIITDRDSGRSKGFGYVEFYEVEHAIAAIQARQGTELDGREIRMDFSPPREGGSAPASGQRQDRAQRYGDVRSAPSATIFVGNISFDVEQSTIGEYFGEHGSVVSVRLPTDRETGTPKGFGYVEMGSVEDATAALEALNGTQVNGRPLRLDYATERTQNSNDSPRGGGFGGRGGRGRGGSRGGFNDRGRGGRGGGRGGRGGTTNRGGFGDFSGRKVSFD